MPMVKPDDFGTNNDGSANLDYCRYCYQNGKFTEPDMTLERMIEKCTAVMKRMHLPDAQISQMKAYMPLLKRWRQ